MNVAQLDRRIEIVSGPEDIVGTAGTVSDLRSSPYVVILGEPGIGKSTALQAEATKMQSQVLKIWELINGNRQTSQETLFLDGLDEYRADGSPNDKAYGLSAAINEVGPNGWRITCRSEDWRNEADIAALRQTTNGSPIVVARLLTLDDQEAILVLRALGEIAPDKFLQTAATYGAGVFTESPLSLELLWSSVSGDGGTWPDSRLKLFDRALRKLAYEKNPNYKSTNRHTIDEILTAASGACLQLLASGGGVFWRSNDEPPNSNGSARTFLTVGELGLEQSLLGDMLDTALFHGEGERFEPMHRSVAEFLAGSALAKAVKGDLEKAALPLSRALALITGFDNRPPTELRGLFAWFAVHLALADLHQSARELIEVDAEAVLMYGDAAAFRPQERATILKNLARWDPFQRAFGTGTAVAALADEDLSAEFTQILENPPGDSNLIITVFDALTLGKPITSLLPLLRRIALDQQRDEWERRKAADAYLNGSNNRNEDCRRLFDDVAREATSVSKASLRGHLASMLPPAYLKMDDLKAVISDYERSPFEQTTMRLYEFRTYLESEIGLVSELFDEPANSWRSPIREREHHHRVDDLLDGVLAALIKGNSNPQAAQIWKWIKNRRTYDHEDLDDEPRRALQDWLDANSDRQVELFDAILADDDSTLAPRVIVHEYVVAVGRWPDKRLVRHIIWNSNSLPKKERKRLLSIAVEVALHAEQCSTIFWELYHAIAGLNNTKRLLKRLSYVKIDSWYRKIEVEQKRRKKLDAAKNANLEILLPIVEDLRTGKFPHHLHWAAENYFRPAHRESDEPGGFDQIARRSSHEVAKAITTGFTHLVTENFDGLSASTLGLACAENQRFLVEFPAIAGLDILHQEDRFPAIETMPIVAALAVLKSGHVVRNTERRNRLECWAAHRLDDDPAKGAAELVEFWGTAIDSGSGSLDGLWQLSKIGDENGALTIAVPDLLNSRKAMSKTVLRNILEAAGKVVHRDWLTNFANSNLSNQDIPDENRKIWSTVSFILEPERQGDRFLAENRERIVTDLWDDRLNGGLVDNYLDRSNEAQAHFYATAILHIGPHCSPSDEPRTGHSTSPGRSHITVIRAFNALAASSYSEASILIRRIMAEKTLDQWRPLASHTLSEHLRAKRDREFVHPSLAAIQKALSGGPPVNAADLRAVILQELGRLGSELHTDDSIPWKRYWNVDRYGKVTKPLIENECRDHLLGRLRDRLEKYRIAATLPEAARGDGTRTDLLVLSGAGAELPIEAKRHFHDDIWSAATTQLQGYITDRSSGYGIYLVFWFGNSAQPTPSHPSGREGPSSAAEMLDMLRTELPKELAGHTDILVFDVADPESVGSTRARRKRKPRGG